jgi:periplasmic divalent cation tolerance protein
MGKRQRKAMPQRSIALIYIPCKNKAESMKIANALLKGKLIACASMFSISSIYKWEGKMTTSKEIVLIAKTKPMNYEKIKKLVTKMHSYSTPCIMKINAVANEPYYRWLMGEMK